MDTSPVSPNGKTKKAWVASVLMGLGHMRAAYPLRDIAGGEIIVDGSKTFAPPHKYQVWKRMRHTYYFMSRAEEIPLIGKAIFKGMHLLQSIPAYYPARDLSEPNWGVRYLSALIRKKGLCSTLIETIRKDDKPLVNTFYATAMAVDMMTDRKRDNYLVICDSDFNRVWVAEDPGNSAIKYLAPCTKVKKRLLAYGVPEDKIYLTGFPLPKENIGSIQQLEILREDLFHRLIRLDPNRNFNNIHGRTVEFYLEKKRPQSSDGDYFVLTFAVGGAGVQTEMAETILKSLSEKVRSGRIKINLGAGIRSDVVEQFKSYIDAAGLGSQLGSGVNIIHDPDIFTYFDKFNAALRRTDVLWTKPSELSFYCALGIPILMAPTVGTHEEENRNWLEEIHTGIKPAGPLEHTGEWLFDLRDSGVLAEAAWDGFLKGRKLGTYKIEELIKTGRFNPGSSPLER